MPCAETTAAVSVAIANWNGMACIARCLDAVFAQTHPPSQVVVVDNGSTDGSRELIQRYYPQVKLIVRPANEGFCQGYNLAIQNARCPYVLILNTDVFLDRDFLCKALSGIRKARDIGVVAARVYQADTEQIAYVGRYLRPWVSLTNSRNVSQPEFVFAGSGSVLFCRRAMLEDIRLFGEYYDASFFAYHEDVDLAWRAQLRGWRCLYAPEAVAHHVGSVSQGGRIHVVDKSAFFQRHIWKNRYLTLAKNASLGMLPVLLPWVLLFECFYWVYLLFRLPHRLPVFFLAHLDFLRLIPDALRKRRCIQQGRRVDTRETLRFFRWV